MFKHGPMEIAQLKRIVEAAILAANTPQTLVQLNELFGEENPPGVDSIHAAIELLQSDYAERGVALVEVASGWRFQIRPDVQPWISRLWNERQTRYTRALLETLALIAYRQPVTRAEIEHIRGVAVSSNMIKTLEEREWIRVLGHRDVPGKPALFGTTRTFLDYFGLKSLDQLPPLAELRDLSELEPQLALDRINPIGSESIDNALVAEDSSEPDEINDAEEVDGVEPVLISDDMSEAESVELDDMVSELANADEFLPDADDSADFSDDADTIVAYTEVLPSAAIHPNVSIEADADPDAENSRSAEENP